tara:strand:+ start:145 stop:282 length:138 start_codon:yes stop_codon:yes gene_type:complete
MKQNKDLDHILPQKPVDLQASPVKLIFEKNKKGKHFLKVLDRSTG